MTRRKCTNVLLVVFCLLLLVSFVVPITAHAQESVFGYVAEVNVNTTLNLREKPTGKVIGSLQDGMRVTILSELDENGYYKVIVHSNNQVGYVFGEYLVLLYQSLPTTTPSTSTNQGTVDQGNTSQGNNVDGNVWYNVTFVVDSDKKLNLREQPTVQSKSIEYLYAGDKVRVLSIYIQDNYMHVQNISTGTVGYVDMNYVVPEHEYDGNSTITQESLGYNTTLVVVSDKKLNMREKPTADSKSIAYLYDGDNVNVISPRIQNNYVFVQNPTTGMAGYVDINFLALKEESGITQDSLEYNTPLVVVSDKKLNMREKPNVESKSIAYLYDGDKVKVVYPQIQNNYILVQNSTTGQVGYVDINFLTHEKVSEENTIEYNVTLVVNSDKKLNMREKPDVQSKSIAYLYDGDKVKVLSPKVQNNYIFVQNVFTGQVGYVDIRFVVLDIEYEDSECECTCNCSYCRNCIYR